jgi:hypothetical protein
MVATMEQAKRRSEQVTGISNVAYDLMTVLTNKLQGMAAIEEYRLDAEAAGAREVSACFQRIEERDRQDAEELRDLLLRHLNRISPS